MIINQSINQINQTARARAYTYTCTTCIFFALSQHGTPNENMFEFLSKFDRALRPTVGDGNCLFRSLSYNLCLRQNTTIHH